MKQRNLFNKLQQLFNGRILSANIFYQYNYQNDNDGNPWASGSTISILVFYKRNDSITNSTSQMCQKYEDAEKSIINILKESLK